MSVELTIIDMKMKPIILYVNETTKIGEIRKLFVSAGGDGGNNQWKYDGNILKDDNLQLKNIQGFDREAMAFSVTSNVRGG